MAYHSSPTQSHKNNLTCRPFPISMASALIIPHLLLLLTFVSAAQPTAIITVGSSLLAGNASTSPWRSPSDDFAFGFQKLNDDTFLLALWFFKTPENTIIWYAKTNNDPVFVPRGSIIELTASGGLILRSPAGEELWSSELYHGTVAAAVINDAGNLILVDKDSNPLWESFRLPTDTLLPTQELLINDVISSRRSEYSFSPGRFVFRLLEDGNAVLNSRNLPTAFNYDAYYTSATRDSENSFHSGFKVVFDEGGFLYVMKRSGERVRITDPAGSCAAKTHYFRASLNFDGVFTVSCRPKSSGVAINGSWTDVAWVPENICTAVRGTLGTGACGYNSVCRLKADRRPRCRCPPGYSLMDEDDEYGSCKPDVVQSCGGGGGGYGVVELRNTDWPMLDYELYSPVKVEECKRFCLEDCLCVVAVYRDGHCWKKKLPLANGRDDPDERSVSFLKLWQ